MDLQVWGTPEQCYERILDIHARTGNSHYVGVFSYAGMPYPEAERNMRLFAREVMPELQKLDAAATPAGGRPARRRGTPRLVTTPLSVHLPFNRDGLGARLRARQARRQAARRARHWLSSRTRS